jgi:hypothetical protein
MKPKSTGLTDNTVEPNAVNSIARRPGSFTYTGAVNGAYYQVNQASYEGFGEALQYGPQQSSACPNVGC